LRKILVPHFCEAGHTFQRVLTDNGSEFEGDFDRAYRDLKITHTRTKPRHTLTNGFVERLQQTILHDHWCIEFRRRYFTQLRHLRASLHSYLRFYNHERALTALAPVVEPPLTSSGEPSMKTRELPRPLQHMTD
jgi:transposase InsO family protein